MFTFMHILFMSSSDGLFSIHLQLIEFFIFVSFVFSSVMDTDSPLHLTTLITWGQKEARHTSNKVKDRSDCDQFYFFFFLNKYTDDIILNIFGLENVIW